jgi:hypothetical protein
MSGISLVFSLIAVGMLLTASRRWAPLPILIAACYIPVGQEIEIVAFHFSVTRLVILAGIARVMMKQERIAGGLQLLDRIMLFWALGMVVSGLFHKDPSAAIVLRLGMAYECLGLYLLFRVFVQDLEDFRHITRMLCVLMIPVAATMLIEMVTGRNSFASVFGGSTGVDYRHGHYRARGPFVHAILAGTIGAVCLPMAMLLWRKERKLALAGMAAAGGIVVASGSSGPVMTTLTILAAMGLWMVRGHLKVIRWLAVLLIIALDMVMNDPVYYLMAKIDITGGSTGWHRAELIRAAIEHFNGWWLVGTDYTRDWMPTGIYANSDNTDITNHFLAMGVIGGLPLLFLFIWVMVAAFSAVGRTLRLWAEAPTEQRFIMWTLGAIMFGHATTFMSISYFGQAITFLYLQLACIGSLQTFQPAVAAIEAGKSAGASEVYEPGYCKSC